MSTLTVWKFDDPEGADRAVGAFAELQKQHLITVNDVATVSWPEGRKKPKTVQGFNTVAAGASGGAFWGFLFGLIFLVPLLGAAMGAAMGAISGSLTDLGINDKFIDDVKSKVTPGTSALFLLSSDAVLDRCHEELKAQGFTGELIQSNLSSEQEEAVRALND